MTGTLGVASHPPESPHDELDKWAKVHSQAVTIEEWMDWLEDNHEPEVYKNRQTLIYEFFDIDPNKLEDQRRALLESIR